ncbi:MAG TPA: DUF2520 domain-containing protein [Bacteroidia bacterium]|nr:DUF2520 domain-containing protein [Bacteroidia bacterium]
MLKAAIIGSGNVAEHLAPALKKGGYDITQVYTRNRNSGKELAKKSGADLIHSFEEISPENQIIFICVSDHSIAEVASSIPKGEYIVIHTSGSTSLAILKQAHKNCGVFYPLQTFTKGIKTDWKKIPICIEGSNKSITEKLEEIAKKIGGPIHKINSKKRQQIHLAAVFANNFSNACYNMAATLLSKNKIDFKILQPLIDQTALKTHFSTPQQLQTGPARRNDQKVIKEHLALLNEDKELANVYKQISKYIGHHHSND